MHNNGVIHRDIKPENVVIENTGYARITDLGIARIWSPDNANETSGTPGYMGTKLI
jgi:serine/threonine protein kinase